MAHQNLIDLFNRFVDFTEEELEKFTSHLKRREYRKGEDILLVGDVEEVLRFIDRGICREFVFKNGDAFTTELCLGQSFCSSYSSFVNVVPSRIGIEALTDVLAWEMDRQDLEKMYGASKEGERMGRLAAEQSFTAIENKHLDFITKSALDRYQDLLNTEPHLLQLIPQKYVAEYLGMTPESLSRLKREVV